MPLRATRARWSLADLGEIQRAVFANHDVTARLVEQQVGEFNAGAASAPVASFKSCDDSSAHCANICCVD